MNRDLDYVLNYMIKYTQDRYMQDSEPMLNHRDIELVLKHIWELEDKIDKAIDMLDLIIPELWNISNAMTYKIKEVKRVLGDK